MSLLNVRASSALYSTEINFDFRVTPRFAKTVGQGLRSKVEPRNTEYIHLIPINVF